MPVFEIGSVGNTNERQQLVRELASEWLKPQPGAVEPQIALERTADGKPLHVYVVWSKWEHIDRVERSEIIMDAALAVLPPDDTYSITIAMGLTPAEANRMGLAKQLGTPSRA